MSWSSAVPVLPFPSCVDMALQRVLGLGAALGRRSCCSKVGWGSKGRSGPDVALGPWP